MIEIENKEKNQPKLTYTVLPEVPPAKIGHKIPAYDEAIPALLNETQGNTISVKIADKSPQQVYNAMISRALAYNKDPNRTYNISVLQRNPDTVLNKTLRAP